MTDLILSKKTGVRISGGSYGRIDLRDCSDVVIENAAVDFVPDAKTLAHMAAVSVQGCSSVTLAGLSVSGGPAVNGVAEDALKLDATGNVIGRPCARGVYVYNSRDVTVEGGEVRGFDRQVVLAKLDRAGVSGVMLTDRRRTAICGSNLVDVTVAGNHISRADPWRWGLSAGDHADCMAFWTDANQGRHNTGLRILGNHAQQLSGPAILGMWFQGRADWLFENATFEGNTFLLANLQGFFALHTRDSAIRRNAFIRCDPAGAEAKQRPTILLRAGATGNRIEDNLTSSPVSDTSGGVNPQKGNVVLSGTVAAP